VYNLFELAHSWGFPHPDLMLEQMTARQSLEMISYLNGKVEKRERSEDLANDTRLKEFFRAQMTKE
jgi:hypothetical protein